MLKAVDLCRFLLGCQVATLPLIVEIKAIKKIGIHSSSHVVEHLIMKHQALSGL